MKKRKFNTAFIKKTGIIFGISILAIYLLFLILPFVISPFINSYNTQIEKIANEMTGMNLEIDGTGIITTPTLGLGIKAKEISITPANEKDKIVILKNSSINLKLLPLLIKKIQLGNINTEDLKITLKVKKNGDFEIFDYLPAQTQEPQTAMSLPFGLKLSNRLPNIKINNYDISITDINKEKFYKITGENLKIKDFVLNKKVKISTTGKFILDNRTVSEYNIKINNNIMPDLNLDDLIFPKELKIEEETSNSQKSELNNIPKINILDIFESINKNKLTVYPVIDVKTYGTFKNPHQEGRFELNNLSVAVNGKSLPESFVKLEFKGKKTNINSNIYTSFDKTEKTKIFGNMKSGDKPNIDLSFKSNAKFSSLLNILKNIARSFNIKDFETLNATGGIDADFNIKSDLKTIASSGYVKIPESSLKYGLYNILINKIYGNIDFSDNLLNIKNFSFSVMGNPLNLSGSITQNADADIKLTANKLSVKALLLAAGQLGILKENNINNGTLSLNAIIKGKLTEIKPDISLIAEGLNIYNKPSNTKLTLSQALIKILLDKDTLNGKVNINKLGVNSAGASVKIPEANISFNPENIDITNTYLLLNNSRIDIKGDIKQYNTKDMQINLKASGNLKSSDIMAFVPKEFHQMFKYTGSMPLNILVTGGGDTQNISFDLTATPDGYIRFLNIDKLRGKNTKIHTDIKIAGDKLILENSGIKSGNRSIATFNGVINNLSNPKPDINIVVPENISFPIPGMGENSNITGYGSVNLGGTIDNPKLSGKIYSKDVSVKDMKFELSNLSATLNGQGISGKANADRMKFDGIIGSNLTANFNLKNYENFYLENIIADVFSGKVTGKVTYNIPHFAFGVDLNGKNLNSTDAVYGAVRIPKALTGTLGFNAKLNGKGITETEIIKFLKGNIDFNIQDGRFVSIGKLENLVAAQNISSNSILKSAISALKTASSIQQTDKFKSISGELTMDSGNAKISNILVEGPLMAYYIKGSYNVLQNSANMIILGRLDSSVVSYLGILGQLSAEKLLSYIPKFGAATAQILNKLTEDPKNENTALIPNLTNGSKNYKDFKVIYNGSLEKPTSIKSFKWLSVCDTSQIDLKQEAKDAIDAAKNNIQSQINTTKTNIENVKNNVNNIIETQKQNVNTQKQAIEQSKQDLKNIKENSKQTATNLKNLLKNAATNANKKIETHSAAPSSNTSGAENSQNTNVEKTEASGQNTENSTAE